MALGLFYDFKNLAVFQVLKPSSLREVWGVQKVVPQLVGKQENLRKTMHLNTVFRKLRFFGESTK